MFVTIGTAKRATLKEVLLQNLQDKFEICAHVCSVVGGFVDPRPLTHDLEVPLMHPHEDSLNVFVPPAAEWQDVQFLDIGGVSSVDVAYI